MRKTSSDSAKRMTLEFFYALNTYTNNSKKMVAENFPNLGNGMNGVTNILS